jgi:hypothetical protein
MAPWLGGAVRKKCRNGKANQSPGLVHFARRIPAAHREQAVRIEPTEKAPPCLDRIKAILSEREGAGTRRRPGIDQAHLDDIERAWCACKPAARLVDLELHPIQYRDRCIVRKVMLQDVDDDRIDLDACYVTDAEEALRQHVPAATHADHGTCLQVRNGIGEVGHVIAQEPQTLEVSIEVVQGSAGAAVDLQRSLLDGRVRHARRGAEHRRRFRLVLTDGDAGK